MTNLNCSANHCQSNQSGLCCAGAINVFGKGAQNATRTCCSTFIPQSSTAVTNNLQQATPSVQIGCNVNTCSHNSSGQCNASSVSIEGLQASTSSETGCLSFSKK